MKNKHWTLNENLIILIEEHFKGVLINSEKVCDSAHSRIVPNSEFRRCSYLLFPTAGAISTCWGIQIASYPDIINENFVSHGAEIWPSNRHPVTLAMFTQCKAFPLLMLPSAQCRHSSIIPKIAHLQVANKPHTQRSSLRFVVAILQG